jgi:hypothetical protein
MKDSQVNRSDTINICTDPSNNSTENNIDKVDASEPEILCPICTWSFPTIERLEEHLLDGFQPKNETQAFMCVHCQKPFSQERALLQHVNFCTFMHDKSDKS